MFSFCSRFGALLARSLGRGGAAASHYGHASGAAAAARPLVGCGLRRRGLRCVRPAASLVAADRGGQLTAGLGALRASLCAASRARSLFSRRASGG